MISDVIDFMNALFGSFFEEHKGFIEVRIKTKETIKRYFYPTIKELAEKILNFEGDVYFGACPRETNKDGTEQNIKFLPAIWGDIDYGTEGHKKKSKYNTEQEAMGGIKIFEFPPSIITHTGHGLQPLWLLREPEEIADVNYVKGIIKGIADHLGGDSTHDIARVLRMPRTWNVKIPENPKPVKILHFDKDLRYNLSDFEYYRTPISNSPSAPKIVFDSQLPSLNVQNLRVSDHIKKLIQFGNTEGKYISRSECDQAVITALAVNGYSDTEIKSIFSNHKFLISQKYLEKGKNADKYLAYSIGKARTLSKDRRNSYLCDEHNKVENIKIEKPIDLKIYIEKISRNIDKGELPDKLEPILKALAQFPPYRAEPFLRNTIANYFNLKSRDIGPYIKELKERIKDNERDKKEAEKKQEYEVVENQEGDEIKIDHTVALPELKEVIDVNFKNLWHPVEAGLSAVFALLLKDVVNPTALVYVDVPSSLKTTVISFFNGALDLSYRSDNFSPKSFVSHYSSATRKELLLIDLLPRIKHKIFLTPELAPIFGAPKEKLVEIFSILIRLLDGEGLLTDSGTKGRRGYTGDYMFTWLGATTPIDNTVWKIMGKLGSRLVFYWMSETVVKTQDLIDDLTKDNEYMQKKVICKTYTKKFIQDHFVSKYGGVRSVKWDRTKNEEKVIRWIAELAKLLCHVRGTFTFWRERNCDEYSYKSLSIEKPKRANTTLYNLARGHALIEGRDYLTLHDIPVIIDIVLSSMPGDRREIFLALLDANDKYDEYVDIVDNFDGEVMLTTANICELLKCSSPTARARMEVLNILGLVELRSAGHNEYCIKFKEEFKWLKSPGFKRLWKRDFSDIAEINKVFS